MQPERKTTRLPLLPILAGAVLLIPLLLVAGCTGQGPSEPQVKGTSWTLTGYVHDGTPVQTLTTTTVTLDFGEDGKLSGTAGCNHYFASYEVKGTSVTIGHAGSTLMYCGEPGVMDQESTYLSLLGQAESVVVTDDRLTLSDAKGKVILMFTRTIPPAPQPLVGTNWTLESFHTADAVSSVISGTTINAVFGEDGKVSGSAGCNRYFAPYTASAPSLSIGPAGSTKMYCSEPGVMQQESTYLSRLSQAKTYTIKGERLNLADGKGIAILTFAKTVPSG